MKTKPYPQIEEKPMTANEPAVAYQRTAPIGFPPMPQADDVPLRPYTMEEINRRLDEAEAEIEAGEVLTSEEVFAEMERKYPWLCR